MRLTALDEIRAGDVAAQNIFGRNGALMLGKGKQITESNIRVLTRIGVSEVYIEDGQSDGIDVKSPLSDDTLMKTTEALNRFSLDDIIECSKRIVDELADNLFSADMLMIRSHDHYTCQHSINVAVYSTVLAKALGFAGSDVEKITQAALLHDIGKIFIPVEILSKPAKLTDQEYDAMKKHSELGYNELRKRSDILSVVRVGVLEHHENVDGSGYPGHKTGDQLHKIGKIIHIADVYDALTSVRAYKNAWSGEQAMKHIVDMSDKMFDGKYANTFKKCTPVYRKGTMVKLSDGRLALVERNRINSPDRPVVRLLDGSTNIDLSKESNISIVNF